MHGVLEDARRRAGATSVSLAAYDAGTGTVRVVDMAGMGAPALLRGLGALRKMFPRFDVVGITFDARANAASRAVYLGGEPVAAPIAELAVGIVSSRVIAMGMRTAGLHHGYVCPLKDAGAVIGAIVFHDRAALTAGQRALRDGLASEVARLLRTSATTNQAPHPSVDDGPGDDVLTFATISMDLRARQVRHGPSAIDLTEREFDLLACFMGEPGKPLSRQEMARRVWGSADLASPSTVDSAVLHLRRKLEADGSPRIIQAVWGYGYMLRAASGQ